MRLRFDPALPISAWHDEIEAAIRDHQVVVIAGETGSGKTTQLPKICLELGRRSIAHTQPRRIAARTVAERIAEELEVDLGSVVGYQVRFTRRAGRDTRLKVMTDGVLLAEIARDRDLRRYDTIIVDEAHERSLNIDFLLGYLRQLSVRRTDLKIIITSATIDTERFAAHFAEPDGTPAPIIEVSGRTFPVEVRYRPLLTDGEADQNAGIVDAVRELQRLGDGDVLVFLSGEREIRDAAEALAGANLRFTEVLPLYARLSAAEQHRVFSRPDSKGYAARRVVLATNVAETSLTVPGIRYVVDTGTARISRYSARTKVQRLPIEPVSQASANQRAGRCGRVAPGVCIRLYEEEDFAGRPEFTEPEILRTNLASVILQMTAAGLGDVVDFPFVDAPDRTQIGDGLRLLHELAAIDDDGPRHRPQLTAIGHRLAQLPLDPRMGRMLLAADREGCLREMLVIVSGLSIVDPRERPADRTERADALHRRFWAGPGSDSGTAADAAGPVDSDFMALVTLWDYLRERQAALSGNAFRRMCRDEFLHFLRIREWQDVHGQLKQLTHELGLHRNHEAAGADKVHAAALTGLLSHVGLAELKEPERPARAAGATRGRRSRRALQEYLGARGTKFAISPGSSLARQPPPLLVAAEIVETTRLWARTIAPVTAEQVEAAAGPLLRRSYAEPHWSSTAGSVLAYETVTLFGVPIVAGRRVSYGLVDPAAARQIFLRSALVEGQWRTRHHFFRDNEAVRAAAEALEDRTRRRGALVDDDTILAFYDARVPDGITSVAHFDTWWRKARQQTPDLLALRMADLTQGIEGDPAYAYPGSWPVGETELPLSYVFDPASPRDGVIVTVPVALLAQLDPGPFSWNVPGLRRELATELIRSLPKAVRRQVVPATDWAGRCLSWLTTHPARDGESMSAALSRALTALGPSRVQDSDWDLDAVPARLRLTFDIVAGPGGELLATGKELVELQRRLAPKVTSTLSRAARQLTRTGATRWDFGTLRPEVTLAQDGHRVTGYPGLVDEATSVGLAVFDTPQRQDHAHRLGLRRLVLLNTPDPTRWVVSRMSNPVKLALGSSPYAGVPALLADARLASVGALIDRHQRGPVADDAGFDALCDLVRADLPVLMLDVVKLAAEVLQLHGSSAARLDQVRRNSPAAADDLTEQLRNLVFAGFLAGTPYPHLVNLPRYLRGAQLRIDTLLGQPARDTGPAATITELEDAYAALCAEIPPGPLPEAVADIGWQLEELRVSLFAQSLRTPRPVSAKRVRAAMTAVER